MVKASDLQKTDYIKIQSTSTVAVLIPILVKQNKKSACVYDGDNFIGIFSTQFLLKKNIKPDQKVSEFTLQVPYLKPEQSLTQVASLLFNANVAMLPVIENDQVIGVVRVLDVLRCAIDYPYLSELPVSDVRHPSLVSIKQDEPVQHAITIMRNRRIDRLPIMDDKEIISFITRTDMLKNLYTKLEDKNFNKILNEPVINFTKSRSIHFIDYDDSVAKAARHMVSKNIWSLVVIQKGVPNMIVTKRDILEAMDSAPPLIGGQENLEELVRMRVKSIVKKHLGEDAFNIDESHIVVKVQEIRKQKAEFAVKLAVNYPGGHIESIGIHPDVKHAVQAGLTLLEPKIAQLK